MRALITRSSTLLAAFALVLLSACGAEDQDQTDPSALAQPVTPAPAEQKGTQNTSTQGLPGLPPEVLSCHKTEMSVCYKNCKADGYGGHYCCVKCQ